MKPSVDEQLAAYAAELRRSGLRIGVAVAAGLAVLVALIVTVTPSSGDGRPQGERAAPGDYPAGIEIPPPALALSDATTKAGCRLAQPPNEGDTHVAAPVRYRANPPTSGDHYARPAADGAYAKPPAPEATVHALEHGRVFIQFHPRASRQLRGQLFALFAEDRHHMLLAPNTTEMRSLVAATAWDRALLCPQMNDRVFDALRLFRDRYRDRGPELVP